MSTTPRPRVTVNGVHRTRTYHYYWCRHCQRSIRTTTANPSEVLCPQCFRQIRLELDVSRPGFMLESRVIEPSPGARALDSMAQMINPNRLHQNHRSSNQEDTDHLSQRARILLQYIELDMPNMSFGPSQENTGFNNNNNNNDNNNNNPGHDEAGLHNYIQDMPVLELTEEHLKNGDSCCPICKDEFDVRVRVMELPCKHFYHSECIVPWLNNHNTCPVCRYEIVQGVPGNTNRFVRDNYDFDYEGFVPYREEREGYNRSRSESWRWMHDLLSLRPLSYVVNWALLCLDFLDDRINNAPRRDDAWWRSLGLL